MMESISSLIASFQKATSWDFIASSNVLRSKVHVSIKVLHFSVSMSKAGINPSLNISYILLKWTWPSLVSPTEGYRDAIVIPAILAENFELKVGLLQLVTSSQFHGFERDNPHAHIRWFNKITSTLKYKNVPHDAIKLMLFLFSLEGPARIWLENEPPCSILTWEDLVSNEAWDRFKELLRKCPHHGFSELHQIDTFYNALTQSDQDSLNAAAGGSLLNRTPRDDLTIIENKSKVRTSRNKLIISKVSTTSSSSSPSLDIAALIDIVKELVLMKRLINKLPERRR
ncbi:hypothetical protein Tco_0088847 [Tanacetum coccineum]